MSIAVDDAVVEPEVILGWAEGDRRRSGLSNPISNYRILIARTDQIAGLLFQLCRLIEQAETGCLQTSEAENAVDERRRHPNHSAQIAGHGQQRVDLDR